MAGGGSGEWFADDEAFYPRVQAGYTARLGYARGPYLVSAGAQAFEGAMSGQSDELVARMGALVDFLPL